VIKLDVRSNEYKLFNNSNSIINFNSKEHSKGAKMLNDLSIGGNKYVCIFTRDSNYLEIKESKKQNNRSCRDSDIDLMIPSVKHLIKNGYYVVRVGSCAKEKMSLEDDMFIDYPFTNNVSEFNDVYLVANADFFVGTSSGICDIATIFDVPRLGVDMTPFGHAPFGQKSMFIPKKIRNNGAVIPFYDQQLIKFIDNFSCPDLWHLEYEFIDNTESEILLAVIDFISFIDSGFVLNYEYADEMGRYYDFFIKNSRFDGVKTPICPSWYNNNTKLYR
jgi:putative glycosyltransferase (TIGR04372 family)